MNRAIFEGLQGRFAVLGHTRVVAPAGGVALPDQPDDNRVRRVVVRPQGDITWTLDGSDPAAQAAMYAKADEILVFDTNAAGVRLAGANIECKIIYFGT